MNEIINKKEHPKEAVHGTKQHIDFPGSQQLTEVQCQNAGYFREKYPTAAKGKLSVPGDGQKGDL